MQVTSNSQLNSSQLGTLADLFQNLSNVSRQASTKGASGSATNNPGVSFSQLLNQATQSMTASSGNTTQTTIGNQLASMLGKLI